MNQTSFFCVSLPQFIKSYWCKRMTSHSPHVQYKCVEDVKNFIFYYTWVKIGKAKTSTFVFMPYILFTLLTEFKQKFPICQFYLKILKGKHNYFVFILGLHFHLYRLISLHNTYNKGGKEK